MDDDINPLDAGAVSRKEAQRILRPVTIGVGALLLAAVDHWNTLTAGQPAHLRTVLQPLLRGSHVAAFVSAGTNVWLSTQGMHPPGHLVKRPYQWSEVSSHGRTYLAIHHKEMEGTNTRRKAFIKQDSQTLQLVGDPTHCELTWDYDAATDSHVRRIWVSAPGVQWERFEIPMDQVQQRYAAWRKRDVRWLPGRLPAASIADAAIADDVVIDVRDEQQRRRTDITTRRPRRADGLEDQR
ncbi:hypothetical protein AXK57_18005 [Tsukamurella pulmonis]|uniref:Uncharacterized protein n=13 Tax=Tsukamurella TaxID=2060 RepID=A0ABS5NHK7_TSUPA|nr:hypothetical protein AXK56_22825 [Tsukamurella pulmonis]KXO96161.1 hypothetical protein AXK58_26060 [Tsukamurella tyrosinosolvens]MBS4103775.1 hypothetical protein [Tsukamurella paurometabola]NKY17547.1 hypothetical protein [Tsukamurella spumae]NMD58505.1 hypothetical protein [Tsukamurella columbiensis]TWS17640.1 hypothetical protein FK529_19510 [Tsukamurella asaccharolytica]TWS24593.1 hypothetical protein FK530_23735 [Tsukamurella conjunctivitidis]